MEIDKYNAMVEYDPLTGIGGVGAEFRAIYERDAQDPPIANLQYIQIARWDDVDPDYVLDNPDTVGVNPFYYTDDENAQFKAGNKYEFIDYPIAYLAAHHGFTKIANFSAQLYLASWDGNTTVTIYDGVEWGINGYRYMDPLAGMASMSAVPEPTSLSLMVLGVLIIAVMKPRLAKGRNRRTVDPPEGA